MANVQEVETDPQLIKYINVPSVKLLLLRYM